MKAVAVSKFRAVPEIMDLPRPEVRPGTVLIRVSAAGINPFDWKMVDGIMDGQMPHHFPLVMGVDGAGVVEAIGPGVSRFSVGDSIYGQFIHSPIGEGSYAEYAIVPEKAAIAQAPLSIPLETAAAVPTAGMTALQLLDMLALQKGQTVLIIGATGGVGSFATQLAALQGLHVIATVSSDEAAARMRELGAAGIVNYIKAPVAEQVRTAYPDGIDGLLDLISSKAGFNAATALVKDGGAALTTAFVAEEDTLNARHIRGGNFETQGTSATLERLAQLIDQGRLKVPVEKVITPEEVPAAIAQSRQGRGKGKTIIRMNG